MGREKRGEKKDSKNIKTHGLLFKILELGRLSLKWHLIFILHWTKPPEETWWRMDSAPAQYLLLPLVGFCNGSISNQQNAKGMGTLDKPYALLGSPFFRLRVRARELWDFTRAWAVHFQVALTSMVWEIDLGLNPETYISQDCVLYKDARNDDRAIDEIYRERWKWSFKESFTFNSRNNFLMQSQHFGIF